MDIVSKEAFLKAASLNEDVVELEGIGAVRIKSLSRADVLKFNDLHTSTDKERWLIRQGLIDPKLNDAEIRNWQENADANTVGRLSEAIAIVSGLRDGADKEAAKSPSE